MKADISRQTFDPTKHYSGVLMQQGRVQLDAEWNEQQEIHQHRTESGTSDAVGPGGVPMQKPGFEVVARNGTLHLGEGHIYVDGVLCVNDAEAPVVQDRQPEPPNDDVRLGLVFLDVWERHVTYLDDGRLREVALGGPDTTTRKQTVWRAQVEPLGDVPEADIALLEEYAKLRGEQGDPGPGKSIPGEIEDALERLKGRCDEALGGLKEGPDGTLNVRVREGDDAVGRCQIPPGGGYERLENQLYRVEVHEGGARDEATFKWSRDNGSILTGIEGIDVGRREITVKNTGRDDYLNFAAGQWVEVVDDRTEATGEPGHLLRIGASVDHTGRTITVEQPPPPFDDDDIEEHHPKLRRWDQGGRNATEDGIGLSSGWSVLEDHSGERDGIEVEFSDGEYRTGDYWLVPARTATGDVEWPREAGGDPIEQPPHGVGHGYGALAVVLAPEDRDDPLVVSDYRHAFPPLAKLTALSYLGGDGQEAMPGQELPEPLRVGVTNGERPVRGARVGFEIDVGAGGALRPEDGGASGRRLVIVTGTEGVATCRWTPDRNTRGQRVRATLLGTEDDAGEPRPRIHFSANLSVASQVSYDPTGCDNLGDAETVQEAIDALCRNSGLYYVGGDGQEAMPGQTLPGPLLVRVANGGWPVPGVEVEFEVVEPGGGTLTVGGNSGRSVTATTNRQGIAQCDAWRLDERNRSQQVAASVVDGARSPVLFTANLSVASQVSYDPSNCQILAETRTVQEALDELCRRSGDPDQEPGIHVKSVFELRDGEPVRNGGEMPVGTFLGGLRIVFDKAVDADTISQATCFGTIDLPWPQTEDERRRFGIERQIAGFQPLVLLSTLEVRGEEVFWRPDVEDGFFEALTFMGNVGIEALLGRFTLKGNFIHARGAPDVYLDGDTFADSRNEFAIRIPTGDGRRGGDFEIFTRLMTVEIG